MPELPEVETVRRGLEKLIIGKKISSIEIRIPRRLRRIWTSFKRKCLVKLLSQWDVGANICFFT